MATTLPSRVSLGLEPFFRREPFRALQQAWYGEAHPLSWSAGGFPAAIREMEVETGLRVTVERKLAEIHFGLSEQVYYLAGRVDGEFGTGTGIELTDSNPDDPTEGIYIPIWMPLDELPQHENVYPLDVAALVLKAMSAGWPEEPIVVVEFSK